MTQRPIRVSMLSRASEIIDGDRDQEYGGPEDSFSRIAGAWTWYLSNRFGLSSEDSLDPVDVALMMDLFKTARLLTNPGHEDSWVDKAGYAACGYEAAMGGNERVNEG